MKQPSLLHQVDEVIRNMSAQSEKMEAEEEENDYLGLVFIIVFVGGIAYGFILAQMYQY